MPKQKSSNTKYLRRSTRRFLGFTRYRSPFEAVLSGVRTFEQWADILNEERELEMQLLNRQHEIKTQIKAKRPASNQ